MKKREVFLLLCFYKKQYYSAKELRHRSTICSIEQNRSPDIMQRSYAASSFHVPIVTLFDHIGKGHNDYFFYASRKPNIFDV